MIASGKMLAEQLSTVSHQAVRKKQVHHRDTEKILTAEIAKRAEIA